MTRTLDGFGLGLRSAFLDALPDTRRPLDWLELPAHHPSAYDARLRRRFEACAERWPMVVHSSALSVGGPDPLDGALLRELAVLNARLDAPFWSDHLCWSTARGVRLHELLPLPFTDEAVEHVAARVAAAQSRAGAPLLLENPAVYLRVPGATMDEATFVRRVVERADCGLLLDVTNLLLNARNLGDADARAYIDAMPLGRVRQIHLAGFSPRGGVLLDAHDGPVPDEVFALYRYTLARAGRMIPTLVEWDFALPSLDRALDEVDRAREHARAALAAPAPAAGVAP